MRFAEMDRVACLHHRFRVTKPNSSLGDKQLSSSVKVLRKIVDASYVRVNYSSEKRSGLMRRKVEPQEGVCPMTDNSHLIMSDEQWQDFTATLESEPKDLPNLRKLFSKPTVFD